MIAVIDRTPAAQPAEAVTLRQAETLVGIIHVPHHFDCMHLAMLAQRQLFGRAVPWPLQAHPHSPRHQTRLIQQHCAQLARPLAEDEPPATGDAVLWTVEGDTGHRHYHIGTLFHGHGQRWVLHISEGLGSSVLQRLDECAADGLRLDGFYRWLA